MIQTKKHQHSSNEATGISVNMELQDLTVNLKKFVKEYSYQTNKKSKRALGLMILINKLRAKKKLYTTRTMVSNSLTNSSCPRCNGRGMSIYKHVQHGVCFRCGRLP